MFILPLADTVARRKSACPPLLPRRIRTHRPDAASGVAPREIIIPWAAETGGTLRRTSATPARAQLTPANPVSFYTEIRLNAGSLGFQGNLRTIADLKPVTTISKAGSLLTTSSTKRFTSGHSLTP